MINRLSIACICLVLTSLTYGQITVTAVQPPAWQDTAEGRVALFPGDEIEINQALYTGPNARVLLTMEEGSKIELGEETQGLTPKLSSNATLLDATLEILKGAFRFTSGKLAANRQRSIAINLPQSTIGIRGTDLWGRVDPQQDFVVLIEGIIDIKHESGSSVTLDKGRTVYEADSAGPKAVTEIDVPSLLGLASETALIPDQAVLSENSRFAVVVASFKHFEHAQRMSTEIQAKGYPSIVRSVGAVSTKHRVQIEGLASVSHALQLIEQLKNNAIAEDGWVQKL